MNLGMTSLSGLATLGRGVRSRRFSSYDRTGGNADNWPIPAGETRTLAEMTGSGCVRHIWMTTSEQDNNLRRLVLRMYWDGEETPSGQCPLGDFFGLGHAKATYFTSLPLQAFYLGLNCWFPLPFETGARITVANDSDADSFLYFYIDYQEWDEFPGDLGRFHANWRRELVADKGASAGPDARGNTHRLNTTGDDNYLVLETTGKGHYVGCCLHLDTNQPGWWGEGDDMFFVDGESWPPNMHGTGTEDYFGGAWGFGGETYSTPFLGYPLYEKVEGRVPKHGLYRWHIMDPIRFDHDLRATIQELGWWPNGAFQPLTDDISSVGYWYQQEPHAAFPPLPPPPQRWSR